MIDDGIMMQKMYMLYCNRHINIFTFFTFCAENYILDGFCQLNLDRHSICKEHFFFFFSEMQFSH